MASFKVGKSFNFSPKISISGNTLFSTSYLGLTLEAMITASEASKYADVATIHKNVLASLTEENIGNDIPANVSDCTFLLFNTPSDGKLVIAEEYINSNSITESSYRNATFVVAKMEDEDIDTVKSYIKSLGYGVTVSLSETK